MYEQSYVSFAVAASIWTLTRSRLFMWMHCEFRYDVEIMVANPSVLKNVKATRIITETVKNNMICIIIYIASERRKNNGNRVKTEDAIQAQMNETATWRNAWNSTTKTTTATTTKIATVATAEAAAAAMSTTANRGNDLS